MSSRALISQSGSIVRYSPKLHGWMLAYAEFLVSCPVVPTLAQKRAELGRLARRPFGINHIKLLEAREDFRAYLVELNKGSVAEARAKYLSRLPKYVDAYDKALDQAVEAKDYKAVAQITEPAIDRIAPKRGEPVTAVQINVTLSPSQLAGLSSTYETPVIEAELLPPADNPDA